MSASASVTDRFVALADAEPTRPLFHFVGDDGRPEGTLTAGQLRAQATAAASFLLDQGLAPGDRVVLAYLPSLDFVVALTATLLIGVIPVPVAPPNPVDLGRDLPRFAAMASSSGACAVLSHRPYLRAKALAQARGFVGRLMGRGRPTWPELPWHATDGASGRSRVAPARYRPSDVAMLQYTSGSTASPKGVRITHGNLAHQLDCNAEDLGFDASSRAVMWLPHFHDFGLVSGISSALRGNGSLTMMSPLTFIRRPELWLETMSRSRATHTAAPNFAYELVVRKTTPAQRAAWDLSTLRVAMSAAEPIRPDVVDAFCDAFAASGFRREAFCPAYGLAEHTVGVSVAGRGRVRVARRELEVDGVVRPVDVDGPATRALVGCGRPSRDVVVRVVDPDTRRVRPDGQVGELWVDSPSKADGYWGLPELSAETFGARLADPSDARGYLRTGDLGFLHDGEVYVTGRLKDLIIVRGRNLYPQDLEEAARWAHEAIRPGGVAAFSVDREGADEELVVLVEARETPTKGAAEAIASAVRRRLAIDHQVACDVVVVGGPGLVRKTTSGKVQRRACRQAWLDGSLPGAHAIRGAVAVPELPIVPTEPAPAAAPPIDPRFDVTPSFRAMITQACRYLGSAREEKKPSGIGVRGWLTVEPDAGIPRSRFFAAGRQLPVLVRHDNRTTDDDAAPDARVAALRVLDPDRPHALDGSLLDLPMLTGRCFFHRTAADFFRFSVAPPEAREQLLRAEPHRAEAAWETIRVGDSYTAFHYHSQTATRWVADDGKRWFARYRLRAEDRTADTGAVDPGGVLFPPSGAPRAPADARPATCLRDDLAERVRAGGVDYVLEVQLRRADNADTDAILDCTHPWSVPWMRLARLHLDALIATDEVRALELNPANAPPELGVVWARAETESASIDHVRTLVYEVAAAARRGRALPPELAAWLAPAAREPERAPAKEGRRVAIVGAGASGLTLARALERRGVRVTVVEREEVVGGMCRTRDFDGVRCDLGGHMIFRSLYPTIVRLASELGQPLVPDYPDDTLDLDTGRLLPRPDPTATRDARVRVAAMLQRSGVLRPGLLGADPALNAPIGDWLARERLSDVWDWMGPVFVGAGYGHLEDQVPALYLAKSFAHTHEAHDRYQLANGYQALWEAVAAELADVRTSTSVVTSRRDASGVTLTTRGPDGAERVERFDQLVVAHSPAQAAWLDATDEERDLFGRVRHLRYVSAFAEVDGLPDGLRERWCFVPETTGDADRRGHVLSFVQLRRDRPIVGLITYEPEDPSQAEAQIREDFARLGATVRRIVHRQPWSYFPHFGSDDLAAGAVARLEALQGQRATWYASTLLSFELTECAAAYAEELAGRIAGDIVRAAPARPEVPVTDGFAAFRAAVEAERSRVLAYLADVVSDELGARPDPDAALTDLGMDSLRAVVIHRRVCDDSGLDLDPSLLFELPTLRALAEHLVAAAVAPVAAAEPRYTATDAATDDLLRQLEA